MAEVCPISYDLINEKVARVNGLKTVALLLIFILSPEESHIKAIILFLGLDFLIRGFFNAKYSPIAAASKKILQVLNIKPQMTNAGPKKFAAKLGFIFSVLVALLYYFGQHNLAIYIAAMFAFFAFLEGAFGFCVACKVYPILLKFKKN